MSETNPMTPVEDQTTPLDIEEPDALFGRLNEAIKANREQDQQREAENEEARKQREAAKAAHKAKILRRKRRIWISDLFHFVVHVIGLLCIAYTMHDFGASDIACKAVVAAAALGIVFWMPVIVKGFPRKK